MSRSHYLKLVYMACETCLSGVSFADPCCYLLFVTLVNVYVDLVVFTRFAGTSKIGSGRYWC